MQRSKCSFARKPFYFQGNALVYKSLGQRPRYMLRAFFQAEGLSYSIPNVIEKLVFDSVGFASKFLSSLMPCQSQWSFAPDKKFCAASLSKFQLFNYVRYKRECYYEYRTFGAYQNSGLQPENTFTIHLGRCPRLL